MIEQILVETHDEPHNQEQGENLDVGDDDGRFHRFCAPAHFLLAYKRQYNIF